MKIWEKDGTAAQEAKGGDQLRASCPSSGVRLGKQELGKQQ